MTSEKPGSTSDYFAGLRDELHSLVEDSRLSKVAEMELGNAKTQQRILEDSVSTWNRIIDTLYQIHLDRVVCSILEFCESKQEARQFAIGFSSSRRIFSMKVRFDEKDLQGCFHRLNQKAINHKNNQTINEYLK